MWLKRIWRGFGVGGVIVLMLSKFALGAPAPDLQLRKRRKLSIVSSMELLETEPFDVLSA